jgi:hypothetical protein
MGKIVGTLRARLGLDTKPFDRDLKGTRARISAFVKGMARNVALAGAAMAAAAVAGGVALTKQSLRFIDEQAKVARTIDGTIDGLRALQMAAGDAGVNSNDLNKSMQMLGARLAEAEVKGGASADALARLGLNARELSEMDADERLATIADRVKELGWSSGHATQFLMDMGIRSKEMALLLTSGGDAIRLARQEVDDLGLSLSAVDAAKIEEANDAMSRIKLVFEAVGNRLAVAVAPALQAMAEGFTAAMREGGILRAWINGFAARLSALTSYISDVSTIIGSMWDAMRSSDGATENLERVGKAVSALTAPFSAVFGWIRRTISFLAKLIKTTGGFGEALAALAPVAAEVWQRIGDGISIIPNLMEAGAAKMSSFFLYHLGRMASKWVGFTQSIAEGMNSLFGTSLSGANALITQELTMAYRAADAAAAAAMGRASSAAANFKAPLTSLAALQAKVKVAGNEAVESLDGARVAASDFNDELGAGSGGASTGGAAGAVDKVSDRVDALKERMSNLKTSMGSAFTSLVTGAKSLSDVLRDLFSKFSEMAANSLFEGLWSRAAGSLSSGSTKSGGGLLGSIFSGFFDNGGNIPSGSFGVVGEYGPEFVRGPANVTSRVDTARMMGGASSLNVTVTMDPSTGALGAIATDAAGQVVAQATPNIINQSVQATGKRMSQTSAFGGVP